MQRLSNWPIVRLIDINRSPVWEAKGTNGFSIIVSLAFHTDA